MHIFPSLQSAAGSLLSGLMASADDGQDPKGFLSILASALDSGAASPDGEGGCRTCRSAMSQALKKAAATLDQSDGPVTLGQEDFASFETVLRGLGLSDEDIGTLRDKALGPEGLRLADVAGLTRKVKGSVPKGLSLDAKEKLDLQAFLQELGVLPQDAEKLIAGLDQDGGVQALVTAIETALERLPEDVGVSLNPDQLSVVAKVMGLTRDGFEALGQVLVAREGIGLTLEAQAVSELQNLLAGLESGSAVVRKILDHAQGEALTLTVQETAQLKAALSGSSSGLSILQGLLAEVDGQEVETEGLRDLLRQFKDLGIKVATRAEEDLAGRMAAVQGAWKQVLNNPAVTEAGGASGERVLEQGLRGRLDARSLSGAGHAGQEARSGEAETPEGSDDRFDPRASVRAGWDSPAHSQDGNSGLSGQSGQSRQDDAAMDFWSRVEVRSGNDTGQNLQVKEAMGMALQTQASAEVVANQAEQVPDPGRGVYRMVESGILQNLGQGTRQITLRLDPPELGTLSVVLSVRQKEVQAVIRTSNEETGRALGEQLAELRLSLEQQGLKVGRLEVQTQVREDLMGQGWLGADGHNQAWQQRQEAEGLGQFIRWLGLRQAASEEPAREVQTDIPTAQNSSSGVDIFA